MHFACLLRNGQSGQRIATAYYIYIHIYMYLHVYIQVYIHTTYVVYIYIYYTAVINDNKCTHVHLVHLPHFVISPEHYLSDLTRFLIITRTYHLGGGITPGRMFLVGRINPKMVENRPTMLINHQSNKDNYHAQYCIKYSNYIYTSYIIYYIWYINTCTYIIYPLVN